MADVDAQIAIDALRRRRLQNRLAQRNRRKRQAQLKQKQKLNLSKQGEEHTELGRIEDCATDDANGIFTAMDDVASGQSKQPGEYNTALDSNLQLNNPSIGALVPVALEDRSVLPLDRNADAGHTQQSPNNVSNHDRLGDSINFVLGGTDFDCSRSENILSLSPMEHPSVGNPTAHQEWLVKSTESSLCSKITALDLPRNQIAKDTLPATQISVPLGLFPEINTEEDGSAQTSYGCSERQGKTALHISAERGDVGIVSFLLSRGAEVNQADGMGRTALHYAVQVAQVEIVTKLLAAGADVERRDHSGQRPIHVAAETGSETIIQLLAEEGADLNASIDLQVYK